MNPSKVPFTGLSEYRQFSQLDFQQHLHNNVRRNGAYIVKIEGKLQNRDFALGVFKLLMPHQYCDFPYFCLYFTFFSLPVLY